MSNFVFNFNLDVEFSFSVKNLEDKMKILLQTRNFTEKEEM